MQRGEGDRGGIENCTVLEKILDKNKYIIFAVHVLTTKLKNIW
jgi:hypothetical protein